MSVHGKHRRSEVFPHVHDTADLYNRLANFAELVTGDDGPNNKWADHMMEVAMPTAGDNGLGVS